MGEALGMIETKGLVAMIEAAAIERHFASPLMMVRVCVGTRGALLPSMSTSFGTSPSWATAWAIAQSVAPRMFSRSIRSTSAGAASMPV